MRKKRKRIIAFISICLVILIVLIIINIFIFRIRKTSCTLVNDYKQDNYKISTEYIIYSKNGIVTKVEEKEVLTSKNTTIVKYFEKLLTDANDKKYDGYTFNIKNDKTILTSNKVIDYEKLDMKNYLKDNPILSSYINKKNVLLLEKAKEMYKSLGANCK